MHIFCIIRIHFSGTLQYNTIKLFSSFCHQNGRDSVGLSTIFGHVCRPKLVFCLKAREYVEQRTEAGEVDFNNPIQVCSYYSNSLNMSPI